MAKKLPRYIAPERRRWALTQEEIAYLIGLKSGASVSRMERGQRPATARIVFAYQALFGVAASELLPALYAEIEDAVMIRAYKLHEELLSEKSKKSEAKRQLLQEALKRAALRVKELEA